MLGRAEEEGWATIEYSLHHREHTCPPASRKQCFPVHPPSPYPMHRPDPRLPAIPEGWPHHLHEANHLRGFPCPGLPALHPNGVAPSTTGPLEMSCSPDIIEQAVPGHPKSAAIAGWSCQFWLPWGSAPLFPSGPASHSGLQGVLHSHGTAAQDGQHPGRGPQPRKA